MPQVQLPVFPDGVTHITSEIAFERREGKVCYFNGHLPVFIHDCEDLAAFRLFSSQLVINGNASQSEISRAFGVPLVSVKRYVKLYRGGGPRAFFAAAARRRGSKLSPELLVEAQALLDEGLEVPDVGRRLGILTNTLHKAIRAGRLHKRFKKKTKSAGALKAPGGQRVSAA
jgi:transposase